MKNLALWRLTRKIIFTASWLKKQLLCQKMKKILRDRSQIQESNLSVWKSKVFKQMDSILTVLECWLDIISEITIKIKNAPKIIYISSKIGNCNYFSFCRYSE